MKKYHNSTPLNIGCWKNNINYLKVATLAINNRPLIATISKSYKGSS